MELFARVAHSFCDPAVRDHVISALTLGWSDRDQNQDLDTVASCAAHGTPPRPDAAPPLQSLCDVLCVPAAGGITCSRAAPAYGCDSAPPNCPLRKRPTSNSDSRPRATFRSALYRRWHAPAAWSLRNWPGASRRESAARLQSPTRSSPPESRPLPAGSTTTASPASPPPTAP